MSRPSLRPERKALLAAILFYGPLSFGCWEQIDDGQWFPQMKRQITVQAYEEVKHRDQGHGFVPPEGTVPVGGDVVPDLASMGFAEQDAVPNPVPVSLESLKNGQRLFDDNCAACHGARGWGDGPVAGPPFGKGPLGLVLPIGGPTSVARALTDGHIYTTISLGRGRMPSYSRIPPESRWDVVNYVRELNGQNVQTAQVAQGGAQ